MRQLREDLKGSLLLRCMQTYHVIKHHEMWSDIGILITYQPTSPLFSPGLSPKRPTRANNLEQEHLSTHSLRSHSSYSMSTTDGTMPDLDAAKRLKPRRIITQGWREQKSGGPRLETLSLSVNCNGSLGAWL
ncbi:hypothetical protein NXS19_005337 [Fusarium pseudograminearum]|nr:hypothetical protein NXS19_005337 [Fusarium pseudograminearum]